MPRLSIVICCPGSCVEFEDTLVSVLQNRPPQSEVLVVHAQPYDDPYALCGEVRFVRVSGRRPSLARLASEGAAAAEGDIVHVLSTRMAAVEGWTDAALEKFSASEVAAVSPLIVSPTDHRVVAAGVNYGLGGSRQLAGAHLELSSRRLSKLSVEGPTMDAGFFRRELLLSLGGWQDLLGDHAADVELAQLFKALELKTALATEAVVHEIHPASRPAGFSRGRALERLFWRQQATAKSLFALIAHACVVMADVLLRLPRGEAVTTLVGRLVGLLHAGTTVAFDEQVSAAREALNELDEAMNGKSTLSLTDAREQLSQAAARTTRRKAA